MALQTMGAKEFRCKECKKLLFKGVLIEGYVEIRCKSCHSTSLFKETQLKEYFCGIKDCPAKVLVKKP